MNRRRIRVLAILVFLAVPFLCVVVLLHFKTPQQLGLPPCSFHAATGLYCPGCGSTRALRALAVGDLTRALRCNVFAVTLLPFVCTLLIKELADEWRGKPRSGGRFLRVFARTYLILATVWFIARNLPFETFDFLRPPA